MTHGLIVILVQSNLHDDDFSTTSPLRCLHGLISRNRVCTHLNDPLTLNARSLKHSLPYLLKPLAYERSLWTRLEDDGITRNESRK